MGWMLSRPALRPTQPPVQWAPGLSQGQSNQGMVLTSHFFLGLGCRRVGAISPPPLRASSGMSWADVLGYEDEMLVELAWDCVQ